MTYYDYKVVPAPRRARKVKGVTGAPELFALTLMDAINEVARQGWEYYRCESLMVEGPAGWFKRPSSEEQVVLIFRREREQLSPRLAAEPEEEPRPREIIRREPVARAEPVLADIPAPIPLRNGPRLGPAEKP